MVVSGHYQKVFEALCTRKLNELARAAYEIMRMPVVVTDAAFIVRAKYPDKPLDDEQWDANVVNRQIEPRFVKTFTDDREPSILDDTPARPFKNLLFEDVRLEGETSPRVTN